mgnify:CR=1 FL=1
MSEYKYLADGHKVRVVEVVGKHSVIIRQYREWQAIGHSPDDYDEVPVDIEGEPHCVLTDKLYDKPPTAVLEENYTYRQEQLQNVNAEYAELSEKVRELQSVERESKRIYDKLTDKYEVLRNLEHFMEHGIHKVVTVDPYSRNPNIVTAGDRESRCGNEPNNSKLKMLSFGHELGRRSDDPKWHLNHYSDLSGSSKYATPCKDDDDVARIMSIRLAECFAYQVKSGRSCNDSKLIGLAEQYGVDIPASWMDKHAQFTKAERAKKEKAALDEIEKAKKKLAALEASG